MPGLTFWQFLLTMSEHLSELVGDDSSKSDTVPWRVPTVKVGWTCVDSTGMSLMSIWLKSWLEPSHMTCVFAGYKRSLLADIQAFISAIHVVNVWTAAVMLPTMMLMYTWLSLAYWCSFIPWSLTMWWLLPIYGFYLVNCGIGFATTSVRTMPPILILLILRDNQFRYRYQKWLGLLV